MCVYVWECSAVTTQLWLHAIYPTWMMLKILYFFFQLKSQRVNVPFNKDNFVDSYFLLSLSIPAFAACYLPFVASCFGLQPSKKKYYVSIWGVSVRRGTIFISIRESKTNKQVFLSIFFFMLLVPQFTDSLWCCFEGDAASERWKDFCCRLKFH